MNLDDLIREVEAAQQTFQDACAFATVTIEAESVDAAGIEDALKTAAVNSLKRAAEVIKTAADLDVLVSQLLDVLREED